MSSSTGYPTTSNVLPVTLGDYDSCGHAVQFYDDDHFLLDALGRFVGSALEAGDAAIVIATEAHRD
ncbi:MAG TPA: hypothetical protein VFH60_11200, partial [Chloroflexia bacterium]|nr:hypothetical protein [Chloroflexia bacterium]